MQDDFWGEAIYAYTVKDAEQDGLHWRTGNDPTLAGVAGQHYRYPVLLTQGLLDVMTDTCKSDEAKDMAGILHDILFVSVLASKRLKEPSVGIDFKVIIGDDTHDLRAVCQPYDGAKDPSPVIVFCLASED